MEDADTTDIINSLWFIGSTTTQPFPTSPVSTGSERRAITAPSSLGFRTVLANLPAGMTQVLTVYVADTAFQEVVDGQVTLAPRPAHVFPDKSTATDVGSFDTFTWTLLVEPCQ